MVNIIPVQHQDVSILTVHSHQEIHEQQQLLWPEAPRRQISLKIND